MKTNITKSAPKFILGGLIAASASFALAASSAAQTNPVSAFPMIVDGQFSNGLAGPGGEWSDVTAANFFSAPGVSATPVPAGDPSANSALYAALGFGIEQSEPTLHLLYDFVPRINPFVLPGEIFAAITFPLHLPPQFRPAGHQNDPDFEQNVSVIFQGSLSIALNPGGGVAIGNLFDILVDLDSDGAGDISANALGLVGAAGFGPSPLSPIDHLIVELGVSLRIPAEFGSPTGPFPGNGINPATGLYDPDPAFWGAAGGVGDRPLAAGGGAIGDPLQPASAANFTINPDGSTSVVAVPEPTSAALLLAGLGLLGARRRK